MWRSLLWKEWSQIRRYVWLGSALAALSLAASYGRARTIALEQPSTSVSVIWLDELAPFGIGFVAWLFALALGAAAIAPERESGGLDFLFTRPVLRLHIWLSKLAVGVAGLITVVAPALALRAGFSTLSDAAGSTWFGSAGAITTTLALATLYGFGLLASTFTRKSSDAFGVAFALGTPIAFGLLMWVHTAAARHPWLLAVTTALSLSASWLGFRAPRRLTRVRRLSRLVGAAAAGAAFIALVAVPTARHLSPLGPDEVSHLVSLTASPSSGRVAIRVAGKNRRRQATYAIKPDGEALRVPGAGLPLGWSSAGDRLLYLEEGPDPRAELGPTPLSGRAVYVTRADSGTPVRLGRIYGSRHWLQAPVAFDRTGDRIALLASAPENTVQVEVYGVDGTPLWQTRLSGLLQAGDKRSDRPQTHELLGFSPEGLRVLVLGYRSLAADNETHWTLFTAGPEGAEPPVILGVHEGWQPSWSRPCQLDATGRFVLLAERAQVAENGRRHEARWRLWAGDLEDGSGQALTDRVDYLTLGAHPTQPQVALYTLNTGRDACLEVVDLIDGRRSVLRCDVKAVVTWIGWSPDGGQLAFLARADSSTAKSELFLMSPDGSNLRQTELPMARAVGWLNDDQLVIRQKATLMTIAADEVGPDARAEPLFPPLGDGS